ncbi:MAG: chemotaxis protein CheW [Leptospiraceae bacterium]|nr:chemotaxis protein CheW [Leptospiraceae bacterium]MDW8305674.1 chemotaxis protein CheW [Leptospiraceae bacterium]
MATISQTEDLRIFLEELDENLNYLDQAIIALEEYPENREILRDVFRAAHTLKGNAGFLGLTNLVDLGHAMETVFQELERGHAPITAQVVDTLLACKDTIASIGQALKEGKDPQQIEVGSLVARVNAILSEGGESLSQTKSEEKATIRENQKLPYHPQTKLVRVWISPHEPAPAVRAYLVQTKLEQLGELVASYPKEEEREQPEFAQSDRELLFYLKTNISKEDIPGKINVDLIERLEVYDEIELEKLAHKPKTEEETLTAKPASEESLDTVRIPVERLDTLLNLVGELVIANSGLSQIYELIKEKEGLHEIEKHLRDRTKEIFRISAEIQELVMKSRLVPIGQLFNRFKRFVRDYALRSGKKIKLIITGEDTEIDKKIIDEMIKPLTHLVRNALDHGIEEVAQRLQKGKKEEGELHLSAFQEGNYINVIVEDDGAGLDYNKIVRKALEKGLISKEQASSVSEEQAKMLIFQPGFSTKDQADDLSGRGMGMDIVKHSVELLNGSIDIHSKVDLGTKVVIKLPLTLAIINALIVEICGEKFSLPMSSIVETQRISQNNIISVEGTEMVQLRETLLPLIRLNKILGLGESKNREVFPIIVVEYNESLVAFLVDNLISRQELVIKSLAEHYRPVEGISGASILGDGSIILILDTHGIIQLYRRLSRQFLATDSTIKVSYMQKNNLSDKNMVEEHRTPLVQEEQKAPLIDLSDLQLDKPVDPQEKLRSQSEKALAKLRELLEGDNKELLKEWLRQGNVRAVEGIRALTGNDSIRIEKSKGRHLKAKKLSQLISRLESTELDVLDFMLPVEPIQGAVHFFLTRKNAEKMVTKLLEAANLPVPKELEYEPLFEVTNIIGSSYTNSLTALTEVMVEPGVPTILADKQEIVASLRQRLTDENFDILYVENEFVWEKEDILAELLIFIPELKI